MRLLAADPKLIELKCCCTTAILATSSPNRTVDAWDAHLRLKGVNPATTPRPDPYRMVVIQRVFPAAPGPEIPPETSLDPERWKRAESARIEVIRALVAAKQAGYIFTYGERRTLEVTMQAIAASVDGDVLRSLSLKVALAKELDCSEGTIYYALSRIKGLLKASIDARAVYSEALERLKDQFPIEFPWPELIVM
jgi:hypothetical protein